MNIIIIIIIVDVNLLTVEIKQLDVHFNSKSLFLS